MKLKSIFCLFCSLPAAVAFSSTSVDPFYHPTDTERTDNNINNNDNAAYSIRPGASTSDADSPWRVALDIGREPLARMPFDWARSGCRMPLVIPTDFLSASNALAPHSDSVSFTGPEGAVVRPIVGERWELSKDERTITLSYTLPEAMERRDVYLDEGTELVLAGRIYTQREMDDLNREYYQAREELWKAGGEIGDIYNRQGASKKWDEESGQWVKRYENENPFKIAQKQLSYWGAKAKQGQKMAQRPDLNELSDRGTFPGVEGGVYFAKGGIVRVGHNGPVCGTWSAMPITGAPASYR